MTEKLKVREEETSRIAYRIGWGWGIGWTLLAGIVLVVLLGPWAATAWYINILKLAVAGGLAAGSYLFVRRLGMQQVPPEAPLTLDRRRDMALVLVTLAQQALRDVEEQITKTGSSVQLEEARAELTEWLEMAQDRYRQLSGEHAVDNVTHELALLRRHLGPNKSDLRITTIDESEPPLQQRLGQGGDSG